jgi:DNA polymerase III alpha subunit
MVQLTSNRADAYGRKKITTQHLCDLLYQNPKLDLTRFLVTDADVYNNSVQQLHIATELLKQYQELDISVDEFDRLNQSHWHMPDSYKELDIAQWILDRCNGPAELQRAGEELILYQERNLFDLLKYLKYLVDTLRANSVLWGVGRGSSVSSFVLYLIGVHRINSLHYDLDIEEFLK